MDGKILQRIAEDYLLQSLTASERQEDTLPVTRDPNPKPCKAWVRFGPHSMLVAAVVVVQNDVACGVEFLASVRPAAHQHADAQGTLSSRIGSRVPAR